MPVTEITSLIVLRALQKIENRGALEMTRRASQYCGQIFRYAIVTGRAENDPTVALKGALLPPLPSHFAAIEPRDLPDFLHCLDRNDARLYVHTRLAIRLMLLTFVRTGELIKATWDEFDLDDAQWTIPAERMKMRRPHIVPLSRQAIAVLQQLYELNGRSQWILASPSKPRQHMSNGTILMALKRMGYGGRMTGHGFRALAMTTIQEKLKYPHDVVDRQLAHAPGDKLAAAYDRAQYLDERRTMMQAWADYLDRIIGDAPNKVVVGNFGRRE
jgi:integrase